MLQHKPNDFNYLIPSDHQHTVMGTTIAILQLRQVLTYNHQLAKGPFRRADHQLPGVHYLPAAEAGTGTPS